MWPAYARLGGKFQERSDGKPTPATYKLKADVHRDKQVNPPSLK